MKIIELTRETWPELETLFSANKTVGGCWCVLDDATPVGWVAVAPRPFYPRRALVRKELP